MEIRTTLVRGNDHPLCCEDFYWVSDQPNYLLFAVMDGCSGGKNSVFASHLFAKLLNMWFGENGIIPNLENGDAASALDITLSLFLTSLRQTKKDLDLQINELESTLLICAINKNNNTFSIAMFGDGFIVVDNEIIDNDQNNTPDYIAHWIDYTVDEIKGRAAMYHGVFYNNIGVATDGVASFREPERNSKVDVLRELLVDDWLIKNSQCLTRRINLFKNGRSQEFPDQKLYHTDDVAIVRYTKIE